MNIEDKEYIESVNKEIELMNEYLRLENRRRKLINEITSSKCTHKSQGVDALVLIGNGDARCTICGTRFKLTRNMI